LALAFALLLIMFPNPFSIVLHQRTHSSFAGVHP
jgi:hypothetical protein